MGLTVMMTNSSVLADRTDLIGIYILFCLADGMRLVFERCPQILQSLENSEFVSARKFFNQGNLTV